MDHDRYERKLAELRKDLAWLLDEAQIIEDGVDVTRRDIADIRTEMAFCEFMLRGGRSAKE